MSSHRRDPAGKGKRSRPDAHADTVLRSDTLPDERTVEDLYGTNLGAGAVIGDYVIDEQRSRGGFAVVYRAVSMEDERPVAIKILRRDIASADSLRRFEREAETIRRLQHPNIVEFLDYGQLTTGQPYMVLEWIEGRTLAEEMARRGPFALGEALAVMEELCAALTVAHDYGVIHRDIKAANVMAVPRESWFTVKLLDFGIAKLTRPELRADLSSTVGILGTPLNMAPEQILGGEVRPATDVYGLGLLLFQLVTGQLPFIGETAIEVEEMHLHAPPPAPSSVAPVPEAFDAVIRRSLDKRVEGRFATAADFLAELRAAVGSVGGRTAQALWGIGVHVEARIDPSLDDPDDDILDEVDDMLDMAKATLAGEGLPVAIDSGNAFLAADVLPSHGEERVRRRRQVLDGALSLFETWLSQSDRSGYVSLVITVHMAPAARAADSGKITGQLLRLPEWIGPNGQAAVLATLAVLDDVDPGYKLDPVQGSSVHRRVQRRAT